MSSLRQEMKDKEVPPVTSPKLGVDSGKVEISRSTHKSQRFRIKIPGIPSLNGFKQRAYHVPFKNGAELDGRSPSISIKDERAPNRLHCFFSFHTVHLHEWQTPSF
jgi:hypothetical protein